jgi:uncharacterized membrane protein YczE
MSTNALVRLYAGLVLFGVSVALMVRADLGLASWDVLHQGLAETTGLPMGWVIIGTGVVVLLLWIPLRQRPGLGTVANVVVVGLVAQGALAILPVPAPLAARIGLLAAGIVLNGVATALYVGAGFGPGPRDGLMTGLAARGHSIRVVRTAIEVFVVAAGWLLGGTVGVGTVLFALAIGPLVHLFLPMLSIKGDTENATPQRRHRQHTAGPGGSAGGAVVPSHRA